MKKKYYVPNAPEHIYQRASDGGVIFFRLEDYLVFFSIISITVKKYGISVMSFCFMLNHIHLLMVSDISVRRSMVVDEYTSMFAKQYNNSFGRKGCLFQERFGRAMKIGEKKVRTCLAYIANNPIEKKLCAKPTDYRWNFLAYHGCNNPFSEPIKVRECSKWLKLAIDVVNKTYKDGNYIRYETLKFIFKRLTPVETDQIADYIITKYNFIDYESSIQYYGSYEKMISAFEFNTGSEYDIREDYSNESEQPFAPMLTWLSEHKHVNNLFTYEKEELLEVAQMLASNCSCSDYHLHKLLRLPIEEIRAIVKH